MIIVFSSDWHLSPVDHLIDEKYVTQFRSDKVLAHNIRTKFGVPNADKLVKVGDLFEGYQAVVFLFGGRKRFYKIMKKVYPEVMQALEEDEDLEIVEGNHDFGLMRYLKRKKPIKDWVLLDGWLFMHGHQADELFKWQFVNFLSRTCVKLIYLCEFWVGKLTKFKLTKISLELERKRARKDIDLRRFARDIMLGKHRHVIDGCGSLIEGVVFGHSHIPDYKEWRVMSLEDGTFMLGNVSSGEIYYAPRMFGKNASRRVYFNAGYAVAEEVWVLDTKKKQIMGLAAYKKSIGYSEVRP